MTFIDRVNPFKKKEVKYEEGQILFHPNKDIKAPLLFCFRCEGKDYFRFSNDYDIPKGRFQFIQKFYQETVLKITSDDLKKFCQAIKSACNANKLGEAYKLADELEYRDTWLFEPESMMRFASAVYFTLDEDVTDYDFVYNEQKIASFKKKRMLVYFLRTLMNGESLLSALLETDLETYLLTLSRKIEAESRLIQESMALKNK